MTNTKSIVASGVLFVFSVLILLCTMAPSVEASSSTIDYDYLGRLRGYSVYKFVDGDNTCYMTSSGGIGCVKTN